MQNLLRSLIRHAILGIALFAAVSAQALTWNNDTPAGAPGTAVVRSLWGNSATNIYAAAGNNVVPGVGRVYRWQGSAWTGVGGTTFDTSSARSIFGFGTQELWVGGLGGAMRRSTDAGATWSMVNSGIAADDRMTAMWGASNTDIWAGGRNSATSQSVLLRYNGSTWTTVTTTFGADEIRGIWGSGANSVFFVGLGGKISRWDGSTLSPMTSGTTETLVGVWGLSANEVYAVGQYNIAAQVSTILKWNGSTWSPFPSTGLPVGILVNGITGSSSNDLYVCCGDTVANLYHWNGTTWSQETTAGSPLSSIWSSPDNSRIVAGGSAGRLYGATATAPASAPTVTTPTQTAITSTTATLGGNVTADGGSSITARGVVFAQTSLNPNPQIGGASVTNLPHGSNAIGIFTVDATSLTPGTQYSFAAYATNSTGPTYTTPVSTFTTLPAPVAITSLTRSNGSPTNASVVNWTLTFASAVTGVSASNFTLTGPAAAGLLVGTPTTSNNITWTIPVTTGSTDGLLTLNLANATGLSTTISTALPFAGDSYAMDKTPPTVLSVTRLSPSGQNTNATTVTFRVTYSEPVALNAPATSRFQVVPVNGSTIVGTVTGVTGSGNTRDVTVNLTSGTGEFRLRVLD